MVQDNSTVIAPTPIVKLKDVAERAQVSVATASRVLNGNTSVGASERERVLDAASQLGYVPNNSARALRSQSTRLVGAIIPTLDHAIYARMVEALQARLELAGMSLIISSSGYDLERERKQTKVLVAHGVEAMVLVGAEHHPETASFLRRAGVRQIYTYTTDLGAGDAAIGFDNAAAARTAADFLLGLGHRHFAMIAGLTQGNDRARQRRDSFLDRLEAAGISRRDVLIVEMPYNIEMGRAAMQQIMETHPRPTAVFCGSDILAVGALRYCQAERIPVPEEVSIMGFDNLEISELVMPGLTTLTVPLRAMGEAAADMLLRRGRSEETEPVIDLPVRLVVRGSTRAPEIPQ